MDTSNGSRENASWHVRLSVAALFASAPICMPAAADGPEYGRFRYGRFLTYVTGPAAGEEIVDAPRLAISFGGNQSRPIVMDTGSTGIVASATQIPDFETLPSHPGRLTYSSSGRIMIGAWVDVAVTISGGNGTTLPIQRIPVLAVTRIACTDRARNCQASEHPTDVDVMGVGFDREHDRQPDGTPDTNPFLNLETPAGEPWRKGYVVTRDGVHVGLTKVNTQGSFHFAKLVRHPTIPHEWLAPSALVTIDGSPPDGIRASSLIDTGVTSMFLTLPERYVPARSSEERDPNLPKGTSLKFSFVGPDGAVLAAYGFRVGSSADPSAPSALHLNTTRAPFVNTGVRFLNGYDVLYDAEDGYLAYRRR